MSSSNLNPLFLQTIQNIQNFQNAYEQTEVLNNSITLLTNHAHDYWKALRITPSSEHLCYARQMFQRLETISKAYQNIATPLRNRIADIKKSPRLDDPNIITETEKFSANLLKQITDLNNQVKNFEQELSEKRSTFN